MKSPPRYRRRFFSPSSHSQFPPSSVVRSEIPTFSLSRSRMKKKKCWKLKTQIVCRIDVNWARIWLSNAREALGRELQHFNTHLNLFEMCFFGDFLVNGTRTDERISRMMKIFSIELFSLKKFAQVEVFCVPRARVKSARKLIDIEFDCWVTCDLKIESWTHRSTFEWN